VSTSAHPLATATEGRQHRSSSTLEETGQHTTPNLAMKESARILAPPTLSLQEHVHTTLCTLPTCDMSLGLLTVGVPEARDFVGSLVLAVCMHAHSVCVCVCVCVAFLSVSPSETYYAYKFSLIHYYTDRKEQIHMTTIHQQPNAPNKTQFMTSIILLHISVLGCHPQGVS
jgi:NADH:ubiquinone oxidoreductase subunit 4 (subunit M)